MNEKVKKLWLKALRSGKYKQGTGQLKQGNNFCCLGVLCDLYVRKNKIKWDRYDNDYRIFGEQSVLPIEVYNWAKLDGANPCVKDTARNSEELAVFNDGNYEIKKRNFKQIANYIEKCL